MKQTLSVFLGFSMIIASFAFALVLPVTAAAQTWDTSGNYIVAMEYQGSDYNHDLSLTQNEAGNLTGQGGSPAGANTYLWTVTTGQVTGYSITFTADYTATPDAVIPQTTLAMVGTIASDGSMSGTWTDNYSNESRSGTWTTTSGNAMDSSTQSSSTATVTISKFVNGIMATASSSNSADFEMTANWEAENIGNGSGTYALSEANDTPYQAMTTPMTLGADYETYEHLNGDVVGALCTDGKPFALDGYTIGNSHTEAMAATRSMTMPSFTNIQQDKYVIVWNTDCANPGGEIAGEVVSADGVLVVTSIEMIKTTAIANGTFSDGWKYLFHITAPSSEPKLAMKFNNWLQTGGSGVIPVANNMRISSAQANNGGSTILLTAANMYSTPDLYMIDDLDSTIDGRQIQIMVEVAVPANTPNGAYTTSYGVQSNP